MVLGNLAAHRDLYNERCDAFCTLHSKKDTSCHKRSAGQNGGTWSDLESTGCHSMVCGDGGSPKEEWEPKDLRRPETTQPKCET